MSRTLYTRYLVAHKWTMTSLILLPRVSTVDGEDTPGKEQTPVANNAGPSQQWSNIVGIETIMRAELGTKDALYVYP